VIDAILRRLERRGDGHGLRVSTDTVKRDWRIARLWLLKAIQDGRAKA
jgi:hypothetical protein